jgi:hypothetical protein
MTLAKQYHARIAERLKPQEADVHGYERGSIAVRLLTESEDCKARIAAHKHLEQQCKDEGIRLLDFMELDPSAFDRERNVQLIATAFVDGGRVDLDFDDPEPAFTPSQVRGMDTVAVDELVDAYHAYQNTRTSNVTLGDDDVADLAARLQTPGGDALLASIDAAGLRILVIKLASMLAKAA